MDTAKLRKGFVLAVLLPSIGFSKDAITGAWRGESACELRESACRDETVVYRFTPLGDKPDIFSVSGDKIVDGKPVNMGTLEFRYVEKEHALICDYAQGTWHLTIEGDTMTGTLTRPDKTVFRRVTLHRQ
jgi:hypothetical protein